MEQSEDEEGEEAQPTAILISLLVELLQEPTPLSKALADASVAAFAEDFGDQAVELLTQVR